MRIHLITREHRDASTLERYMILPILRQFEERGHQVSIGCGVPDKPVPADLAIMHVDLTVVPQDYAELARHYPVCVNGPVVDITKRVISEARLEADPSWDGPVLVKPNLNYRGIPEQLAGLIADGPRARPKPTGIAAAARSLRLMFGGRAAAREEAAYAIYDRIADVPADIRDDPNLVIDRFLPERIDGLHVTRFWTFSGTSERCAIVYSHHPIVKASQQVRYEICEVPDELRETRRRLGFDYGKFDFVMHDGEPVLLDANKTPGRPPVPKNATWPQDFAGGLLALVP